mmetsp:Transcript_16706/g.25941  ORF Transcript_16706/g.25941 Transcript_16706/m.25941 type:complete len:109 (-) Transcript_16706:85-411(-)
MALSDFSPGRELPEGNRNRPQEVPGALEAIQQGQIAEDEEINIQDPSSHTEIVPPPSLSEGVEGWALQELQEQALQAQTGAVEDCPSHPSEFQIMPQPYEDEDWPDDD